MLVKIPFEIGESVVQTAKRVAGVCGSLEARGPIAQPPEGSAHALVLGLHRSDGALDAAERRGQQPLTGRG